MDRWFNIKPSINKAITKVQAIVIALIIILAIVASVYLLTSQKPSTNPTTMPSSTTTSPTNATKVVYIGALLPLTGQLSSVGQEAQQALEYAQQQANTYLTQIGSNIRIQIMYEDTQTNPNVALQDVQTLYSSGVKLLIGPFSSGEIRQIKQFTDQNNMIVFSPSSTAPSLAIANDSVFRDVPNDTFQGAAIAHIMWNQGIKAIAVIWRGDTYGDGLVNIANKTFTALGGKVELVARYDPSATDFSSYVSTLANTVSQLVQQYGADHVAVYVVSFEEIASIFQVANQYPVLKEVKWYGSDGTAGVGSVIQNPVAAQFSYNVTFLNPIAAPAHTEYYDMLTKHFNKTLQAYSYITYDIFWIYVYSILAVGGDNVTAIKHILPTIAAHFFGASGYHVLDKFGDRSSGGYELLFVNKTSTGYDWAIYGMYDITTGQLTIGMPPLMPTPQGYLTPADPQALSKIHQILTSTTSTY